MSNLADRFREKTAAPEQIPAEQFRGALATAIKARAQITYFIWKELKKTGQVNATQILRDAYTEYGIRAGEAWGNVQNPGEALVAQSSMGGCLVFQQELVECTEEYAQKRFHHCPHVEAFRELGASDEEIRILCREILSAGDYANLIPHEGIELVFEKQIGNGDSTCEYCLRKCGQQ